ncbi:hypothetical protein LEM8419_02043 [Neolewinella maritima]|uniref:Transporter n=1 Tax=Neolewinella maritima TaxID=1383882 RepID=A0ABM9B243_9BACT|nr:hypothetical protein [Neolewinella maritima]CAH1001104.1 hypothetical protein LEM8419_02043 [Neolewinella maritima]
MAKGWLISALVCGLLLPLPAQDFGWWNTIHQWDGHTPWTDYLTLAPAYLGPNALPVPDIQNGRLDTRPRLRLAGEAHFSDGDGTQNLLLDLSLPLFSDRVAFRLQYVPLEYYRMDVATRDLRAARDFDGRGTASGDVYLSTYVQLLRDHPRWPDVLLTINLRTASGNKLSAARFTDTPGYFFDVSVGKEIPVSETVALRPHLMAGFYVWQTFTSNHFQNDALLYGLGADLILAPLTLTGSLGGYWGYLGEGDRPLVCRLDLRTTQPRRINYVLRLQQGLKDFGYSSLRIGLDYRLKK